MPLASKTMNSPITEYKSISFAFFTLDGSPPDDKNKIASNNRHYRKNRYSNIKNKIQNLYQLYPAKVLQVGLAGGQNGLGMVTAWILKGKIILKRKRTIIIFKTEDFMILFHFTII